jgi:hypothetical protein
LVSLLLLGGGVFSISDIVRSMLQESTPAAGKIPLC